MATPDLSGRTAIVTGASRGIGLAIAESLVAAGASAAPVKAYAGIGSRKTARPGRPHERGAEDAEAGSGSGVVGSAAPAARGTVAGSCG